jgi:hypothetical protein
MATLDWHVAEMGGVSLVSLLVTGEQTRRVRIENCLDGPVWPPRRQGVPEAGWDGDGFEATVAAGERLVVGYASPAESTEPPARIVDATGDGSEGSTSARDVIRTLGDPRPPRDAVPADGTEGKATADAGSIPPDPAADDSPRLDPDTRAGDAVDAWLDGVRARLEAAERLARVTSVEEATEAVASVGGAEDLATLRTRLEEDRERLEALATESESLAARIDRVSVPVETLQQLT